MKVKGFEKAIVLHLGCLFDAVNEEKENVQMIHRMLLNTRTLSEEAVTKIAVNGFSKALGENEIDDPAESQYTSWGFAPFGDEVDNAFALAIPGTKAIVFRAEKRERILPAISVRRATAARMAELAAKEIEGYKPTRKEWAQMKDEVQAEMLKGAPIRPTQINIILDVPYVYVHTTSAKVAEDCSALIRRTLGTWPVAHALADEYTLQNFMGRIINGEEKDITGSTFAHIKHQDGDDVKVKDISIEGNEMLCDLLDDQYKARSISMRFETGIPGIEDVFFKLSDKAILSDIHVGDADVDANYEATLERYGTDGGQFLTMMANLFQIVHSMRAVLALFRDRGMLVEFTDTFEDPDDIMCDDEDDDEV